MSGFGTALVGNTIPAGNVVASRFVTDPPTYQPYRDFDGGVTLVGHIALRLRWLPGNLPPLDALFAHRADDKVFVFVVVDGQAVTLEDGWDLFPSDALITQLRLLEKKP